MKRKRIVIAKDMLENYLTCDLVDEVLGYAYPFQCLVLYNSHFVHFYEATHFFIGKTTQDFRVTNNRFVPTQSPAGREFSYFLLANSLSIDKNGINVLDIPVNPFRTDPLIGACSTDKWHVLVSASFIYVIQPLVICYIMHYRNAECTCFERAQFCIIGDLVHFFSATQELDSYNLEMKQSVSTKDHFCRIAPPQDAIKRVLALFP